MRLASILARHSWFEVVGVSSSSASAGRPYGEFLAGTDVGRSLPQPQMDRLFRMVVEDSAHFDPAAADLLFSALPSAPAQKLEAQYARSTPVVSTSSAFRMEPDTPILLGGVNTEHTGLLETQQRNRCWKGFVAPKPNCAVAGLATTLAPLRDTFGLRSAVVTTMQAVSGAGLSPGVRAFDVLGNIIPYIPREEQKVACEPRKILGRMDDGRIELASFSVDATCTRVPVLDGHLMSVYVRTERPISPGEARRAFESFGRDAPTRGLPSSPKRTITVCENEAGPQPRLDRDREGGMTVTVGRLRSGGAEGLRYLCLVHNTKLGAAKGAVLTAEYLASRFLRWV